MKLVVNICAYDSVHCHGGPHVWITRIASVLSRQGVEVCVTLLSWDSPEQGYAFLGLQSQHIRVQTKRITETSEDVAWLLREVERSGADIFVVNNVIPAYYAVRYLNDAGIATVGVIRSDAPFYDRIAERFAAASGSSQVSGLVFVSDFLRDRFAVSHPGFPVCTIPSGTIVPTEPNVAPDAPFEIAFVGRLVEEAKQIIKAAESFVELTKRMPDVRVTLYGEGDQRSRVEDLFRASGSDRVRLAGHLPDEQLRSKLLNSHVICLLSDFEGSPMAVMDGMACGCVPVCLGIRSGIPDLVQHEVTGLIVKDRWESFFAAISRLYADRDLWRRLSVNARSFADRHLSVSACGLKYVRFFEAIAAVSTRTEFHAPNWIELPPFDPIFASEDNRRVHLSILQRLRDRARNGLGSFRRRISALSAKCPDDGNAED